MRKVYATFSGEAYNSTTKEIVERAPKLGADTVAVYDDLWLTKTDFYRRNQWLWTHHGDQHNRNRGFGWFAFKSVSILDALSRLSDGDFCLFTDADCFPVRDFSAPYSECARIGGVMLFGSCGWGGCQNIWCKRDCFIVMGQDEPRYWYADHGCARFMVFQKGPWLTSQFLSEWLAYCVNPLANTLVVGLFGLFPSAFAWGNGNSRAGICGGGFACGRLEGCRKRSDLTFVTGLTRLCGSSGALSRTVQSADYKRPRLQALNAIQVTAGSLLGELR